MTITTRLLRRLKKLFEKKRTLGRLNRWQEAFCVWNAERLGISVAESRRRYEESWTAFATGHGRDEYRDFCTRSHRVFSVIANDRGAEVYEAYRLHGLLHFLRMLSYEEHTWPESHPIFSDLPPGPLTVLDFGCGLAQASITLAESLRRRGRDARLFFADIPTLRRDFLLWFCRRLGLPAEFGECTKERPIPDLPPCHFCIALEVLEHLHEPLTYLEAINGSLHSGGFLLTNVRDHQSEFMHVSPNLTKVRDRLVERGFAEITPYVLYRKSSSTDWSAASAQRQVETMQATATQG